MSGLDVRKEDARPEPRDAPGRGEKRVGRGDHRVPGPDAQRHQDRQLRIRPRGDADRVRGARVCADFAFEAFDLRPEDELLGIGDLVDLGANLVAERLILFLQVEEGVLAWVRAW